MESIKAMVTRHHSYFRESFGHLEKFKTNVSFPFSSGFNYYAGKHLT
jgi:hypothetical protein